jgi:FixJ family two-component response regulator
MFERGEIGEGGPSSEAFVEEAPRSVPVTYSLSPRERQVMTLIVGGKTRKEVAFDLGLAHSTVRVLYGRARKKLVSRKT